MSDMATAREVITDVITDVLGQQHEWNSCDGQCRCGWRVSATKTHSHHQADALLTTLDAAGWELKRKPEDRWGFYLQERPGHVYERYGEDSARRGVSVNPEGRVMVRWPHGGTGWEVVPDAAEDANSEDALGQGTRAPV